MTYLCLVPEDAKDDEHLTLVWRKDPFPPLYIADELITWASKLPIQGFIAHETVFGNKLAYLVHLPHEVHLWRASLGHLSQSEFTEWNPHITYSGKHRMPGFPVVFDRIELR